MGIYASRSQKRKKQLVISQVMAVVLGGLTESKLLKLFFQTPESETNGWWVPFMASIKRSFCSHKFPTGPRSYDSNY